jgi:hypothetical protein
LQTFVPATQHGVTVSLTTGQALAHFCELRAGPYTALPQPSDKAFAVENRFGRGTAVFLAGSFGQTLAFCHFPEYVEILAGLCGRLSKPLVKLRDAPRVDVSLRRGREATYLHLVNRTSGPIRPITAIEPLQDVEVILPGATYEKARLVVAGDPVAVERTAGGVCLVLPRLEDYEVVALM